MPRTPAYVRLVSYHAVTRYCQRLLNVTVPIPDGGFANIEACALAHCRAAGFSVRHIKRTIFTPGIELAVSLGVSSVSNGRFSVKINPSTGVITTVRLAHERSNRRMRLLSDRELRVKAKKINRKLKRRPHRAGDFSAGSFETELENI